MIPILYDADETKFATNGVGTLTDVTDATVEEELNGSYELEMSYPVEGIHFSDISRRSIILSKTDSLADPQPFRVYQITKPLNGKVKIYARHVAYDLQGIPISPFTASSAPDALNAVKTSAATDFPFSVWTDKTTVATMTVSVPTAAWSLLGGQAGSILDTYGGEYEFDRWTVKLHARRGEDRGVIIRYGKNLQTLEQDENCANCCTGLYPYWTDSDGNLVELPEKIVNADGSYGYTRIIPMDFSGEWDEAPTDDQLRARTKEYMSDNDIGVPEVSLTIGIAALEQTEEYKSKPVLERIVLGDTVSVEFAKMGISATARVVATKYKPILERFESVTLGKVKANLASTIVAQEKAAEKKPDKSSVQKQIMALADIFTGVKGGAVRLLDTDGDGMPDELYIADNADPNLAVKVWRFNYLGWAASSSGYSGPFTMGATLEDGILANAVTAANLVAGTIKSADGEAFFLDLDNGILRLKSTATTVDGEEVVTVKTMQASIKTAADGITTTVSNTYVPLSTREVDINNLNASIRYNASSIQQLAESITLKVSKDDVYSCIEEKADSIRLKTTTLTWSATNSSMTADGTLTCKNVSLSGNCYCGANATRWSGRWVYLENGVIAFGLNDNVARCRIQYYSDTSGVENILDIIASGIELDGNLYYKNGSTLTLGYTGTVNYVSSIMSNGDGTITWWTNKLTFHNGGLVAA